MRAESEAGFTSTHEQRGPGGPLWLLAVMLITLPWLLILLVFDSAMFLTRQEIAIDAETAAMMRRQDIAASIMLAANVLLVLVGFITAELFFRRSVSFPRFHLLWQSGLVLTWVGSSLYFRPPSLAAEADGGMNMDRWLTALAEAVSQNWLVLLWAMAWIGYLHVSQRARSTFAGDTYAPTARPIVVAAPWKKAPLSGPANWDNGIWILPGYLMVMLLAHAHGMQQYAAFAPWDPASATAFGTGLLAPGAEEWLEMCRIQVLGHALAFTLTLTCLWAFARRSRWGGWLCVALALTGIALPGFELLIRPARPFLDGPSTHFEVIVMLAMAGIVLSFLAVSPRARYLFWTRRAAA